MPMTMASRNKHLYQLPQKQIDRAERRQAYDRMKVDIASTNVMVTATTTAVATTNASRGTASATSSAVKAATTTTTTQQMKQKSKQHRAAVVSAHSPADVAALPLLAPFQIRNPSESSIVNTIINEQHAADTLAAMLKQEEKLRGELQKAKSENSNNGDDNDKKKSKKSNKKSGGGNGGGASAQVKEIEFQIDAVAEALHQCRQGLASFAGWTLAMLQAEYSKLAVTLDQNSKRYEELEEAFSFLCPRLPSSDGSDEYFHEQRLAYVREIIHVMKKAGERNFPTSLLALPYVKKFQCDDPESPIVAALIDEMHQLAITEGTRTRLEKQVAGDRAKFCVLRREEEALERREAATSELVRKHYRKRSIQLHPDRNGEHMRPIFEEFTDARTVLSDVSLRQSYLRGMLDVFKYYGTTMMSESHDAWNRKHRPDVAEDAARRKGGSAGGGEGGGAAGEGKPLKIEGGLHQQVPRGVVLHHRRDGRKNHVVSVSVHVLRPVHEFYARVRSVRVEMRDTANERHVVELSRREIVECIKFDRQGPILANEIPITEMLLNPGHWEVFWCATLDTIGTDPLNPNNATEGESVTTRQSAVATFHVVDYDQLRKCQDFDLAETACKVIKGELANTLHKLRTNQLDSASMSTPARFGHYHQILVRARKKCSNLHRLMTLTGRSSGVYDGLSSLLSESRQVFAELEKRADAVKKRKEKKDDAKRFKAYVASVLESDDPLRWMKDVGEAQLYREGGDVNRLYQLFFEGKGKYVLLVDSEMYKEASLRDGMFSTKQCKDLALRAKEVAVQEAKEEEEAAAEEEKRRKEEKKREKMMKEAELREKWAMVGQNANIRGLTSEKGKLMNHQTARILYYVVDKDRFEVQLYKSDEKAYLKKENLTVYYGYVPRQKQHKQQRSPSSNKEVIKGKTLSAPPPMPKTEPSGAWNCNKCTFENDDASTACSICANPRPKVSKQEQPTEKKELDVEKGTTKITDVEKETTKTTITLSPLHPGLGEKEDNKSIPNPVEADGASKVTKTIYVRSTLSKKLTGKRGRKKKDFVNKSGADEIRIETSAIGNHVPVHLTGSRRAVSKAVMLIQEAIGMENVSEKIAKLSTLTPSPPQFAAPSSPMVVSPTVVRTSISVLPLPAPVAPPPAAKKPTTTPPQTSFANPVIFSGFHKPVQAHANGIHHISHSESETQPTSQYSFGDALLPRGLMDMSVSTPTTAVPPELPSEIGIISSQGMTRESITEASVSSLNDRSNVSKALSNFTLNENDPLLMFLRAHQQCVKGSVDEFYIWLVKSEDIDSMLALKEAVADEDYLNYSMKVGNGSCGLKGFKRKAFQRAVFECDDAEAAETNLSPSQNLPSNDSNSLQGNAFLPSNLFSGNDEPTPRPILNHNLSDPPEELVCPIGLVLMTVDPVLAADGVTYERASIQNWFRKNMTNLELARENLKRNPRSERDQRVVESGIRSPAYGTMMKNLSLTPNTSIRNMARAYKERKDAAGF